MNNGIVYSLNSVIPIGYVGENETREIAIDIRPLIRAWPDLAPVLLAKRPGETALYPCVTRVENGVLYWRATLSDTAIPGKGECVIHMIDGEGRVGKSRTMTTMIERSASGEETQEPPEAIKPWIDDVLASIESVKEGYIEIEQGEENAGLVLVVGEDGRVTLRKGGAGGDGVGVESVEQTQESTESGGENVWTLRLTDGTTSRLIVRNGARGAQGERGERGEQGIPGERGPAGKDGEQGPAGADGSDGEPGKPGDPGPAGEPGKDGSDGVSPITSFERIDGGYRLTIKDAAGTHSVEIMDGVGVQGPAGPQGPEGPAGERGEQGERGAPFAIAKIYSSVANMNAGYATDGVPVGGFVLIETGDVNDEENARLYVKGESRYEYVTDLSGAQGIQGPEGKQGPQGPAGNPGAAGADGKDGTSVTIKSVSESSADGGSNVVTFSDGKTVTIKNGKTGAQGPMGPTGEIGPAGPTGPAGADGKDGAQGPAGPAGSDAAVTATNIQAALGYKPASEASISQLSEKIEVVPDYVITEADAVISRTLDAQTSGRVFTLAAISDMHYGSGGYTDGILHASHALKRIAGRIKLDAVAVMGDYTDLYASENYSGAIADTQAVNALMSGVDADTMALVGNHDFHAAESPQVARALLGKSDNVTWGSRVGGYYYRDFDAYRLRVIVLNTSETDGSNIRCSNAQYNWFMSALDMSAKEDVAEWQILILSHHPLDWYEDAGDGVFRFGNILDAYTNGKSWSGGGLSCNFEGKNAARIVCNVHGHIHNLKVDKIHTSNASQSDAVTDVYRMCIPESCFDRPQSYGGVWDTETTYTKTANSKNDTSFTVLCIDLEHYTIRAVNYGAGIDRELVYYDPTAPKYTNMLLMAVGSDGKPFNGGQGWKAGYRLNSSGAEAANADYYVTGFIPIKDRDTLYLRNMNFVVGGTDTQPNTRLCTYNASFSALANMLVGDVPNSTIFNAIILDEDGGALATGDAIGRMRIDAYNDNVAYIRFSTKGMSDESIVTVNEPII